MFKRERGFTIIELLIVLAVIGIIAGIAVSAFDDPTSKANTAKDKFIESRAAGENAQLIASLQLKQSLYKNFSGDVCSKTSSVKLVDVVPAGVQNTIVMVNEGGKQVRALKVKVNAKIHEVWCFDSDTSGAGNWVMMFLEKKGTSNTSNDAKWQCFDSTGFAGKKTGITSSSNTATKNITGSNASCAGNEATGTTKLFTTS